MEGVVEPLTGTITAPEATGLVRRGKGVVLAWALYDYARTIFSYSVLSVNFSLWVTQDHGAPVIVYTLAGSRGNFGFKSSADQPLPDEALTP